MVKMIHIFIITNLHVSAYHNRRYVKLSIIHITCIILRIQITSSYINTQYTLSTNSCIMNRLISSNVILYSKHYSIKVKIYL